MNVSCLTEQEPLALVEIIQFKWLMAHEGRHVHVERMQTDAAYAREQLDWADTCGVPALHGAARTLRLALGKPV